MRSETVTAVYRSTAVELQTDEHASVVLRVEARTLRGNRFFIRPRLVVLAMGGIENARLLLLSDHVSRQGLGNRHDLVGRFFMDHYMIHSGYLYPRDPGIFDRTGLYDLRLADDSGLGIQGKLTLRPEVICDEHLLNAATYLVPRHRTWPYKARARESLRELRAACAGRPPRQSLRHARNLARWPIHLANAAYRRLVRRPFLHPLICEGGWSDVPDKAREFALFEVMHLTEQSSSPANRVTLVPEVERAGVPQGEG